MIVQNPLVPPQPAVQGNTSAPVANAPAAAQNDRPETERPVKAAEPDERSNAEDRGRQESGGGSGERGQQLDILV
jgi:hypothetical protein